MNAIQKQWLVLMVAVMAAMLIFPPWTKARHQVILGATRGQPVMQTETQEFAGYAFLFDPPAAHQLANPPFAAPGEFYESVSIAVDRLLMQWLSVAFLTGAGLLFFKGSDKKSLADYWTFITKSADTESPPGPPRAAKPEQQTHDWLYYDRWDNRRGPVSESELLRLFHDGEVASTSLVWREGLGGWVPFQSAFPDHCKLW